MSNRLSQEKSPYLQQPVTDFRELPCMTPLYPDINYYTVEKI